MIFKPIHAWSFLLVVALAGQACQGSPTSPSSGDPASLPAERGSVRVTINPNPVPLSGAPVTDTPGCADVKNSWYYDQNFEETAGAVVTLSSRVDFFDGFAVNNINGLNIVVPARGGSTLKARWCSGNPTGHTAQSTFSGVDDKGNAITVNTPVIRLMAP